MLVTALVTPFRDGASAPDLGRVEQLVRFQVDEGVHRVLLFGTTGEGGSLTPDERTRVLDAAVEAAGPEPLMAGLGFGRVDEVVARGREALERGVRDLLLVDCPYSGAASSALRTGWYGPVAQALPEARLFPYAVPGRTGTELLPDDLARLAEDHANVVGVKDATGRLARMTRVRELCGDDFLLLCGDDHHARDALVDPTIRASGVCSVVSNLAPATMGRLVQRGLDGAAADVRQLHDLLEPLFGLVSLTSAEKVVVRGEELSVPQRARNPVPLKAAFAELGIDLGGCRPPLGPLGPRGRSDVGLRLGLVRRRPGEDPLAALLAAFGADAAADTAPRRELAGRS